MIEKKNEIGEIELLGADEDEITPEELADRLLGKIRLHFKRPDMTWEEVRDESLAEYDITGDEEEEFLNEVWAASIDEQTNEKLCDKLGLNEQEIKQFKSLFGSEDVDEGDFEFDETNEAGNAERLEFFRAVVQSEPQNAQAHYNLGVAFDQNDQMDEAITAYEKAIEINWNHTEIIMRLGVSFFDAAGNAYFNEPGLYIFITGQKATIKKKKIPRLFRPPGMKLLFAFFTKAGLENESYRSISAATTNVPTPTVGVFMKDLEKAGFLIKGKGNNRRIIRRDELFRRWLENYGESFRPTLNPVRFQSKNYKGRWWENVNITEYDACWGGETGGAILTNHLKPEIATIYSDSLLPRLQAQYGLIRDESGNIEILDKFWTQGETDKTAPPLIIYADLVATADGRNLETAQIIYERYLSDIAKTAS